MREHATRAAVLKALKDTVEVRESEARAAVAGAMRVGEKLDAELPDGTRIGSVSMVGGRVTASVADEGQLLAWVAEHHPTEIEEQVVTVRQVRPAFLARLLSEAETDARKAAPGIGVKEGDPYPRVTLTKTAPADVLAAIRSGQVEPLALPGGEDQ